MRGCNLIYTLPIRYYMMSSFPISHFIHFLSLFICFCLLIRVGGDIHCGLIYICLRLVILEHPLIYLLVISVLFFEKCLFRSSAHFKKIFVVIYWIVWISHRLWVLTPLSDGWFASIFFSSHRLPFILWLLLLLCRSFSWFFLIFKNQFLIFALLACAFGVISTEFSLKSMSKSFFLPFLL